MVAATDEGIRKQMTVKLHRTVVVSKPLDTVFRYLADFTTTEQWDPPTRSTVRSRGDGGVGTVYDNVSSILGRDVPVEYTVVGHDAPTRLQLRGRTSSMNMLDTITITPQDGGVRLWQDSQFRGLLVRPLIGPLNRARLSSFHAMNAALKDRSEGMQADASAADG